MRRGRLEDWIALNLLPGLGPVLARRALERFGGDPGEVAYRVPAHAFTLLDGVSPAIAAAILDARPALARGVERELRTAEKLGLRLVARDAPEFPAAFEQLADPPILLYLKGTLRPGLLRIAVVGSRRSTLYGKRVAAGLASALAARGVEIVSGGARGIDTAAHAGALEDPEGRTLAVLGSGFLHPYPPENRELFETIASRGGVLTELALDCGPLPGNFPRRNRLISGLSAAVVVVEAGARSGSLITAAHALEQGREVLAVPGPVFSEQSRGCHQLIQQGARLVQNAEDVLDELSPMYRQAVSAPSAPAPTHRRDPRQGATADEAAVLDLLDEAGTMQLDELADRARFGIARLQAALFGLEVAGAIESLPGRHYQAKASLPPRQDRGA